MLRYNWELLYKSCNFDKIITIDFLMYLRGLANKIPLKKLRGVPYIPKGESYILDIDSLLADKGVSKLAKFEYLELCSKRNITSYMFFKDVGLHKALIPNKTIKHNILITENKDKLLFKYEQQALEKQQNVRL